MKKLLQHKYKLLLGTVTTGLIGNYFYTKKFENELTSKKPFSIPKYNFPARENLMERLENEEYDILIIGGGATGAGLALEGVTRGLKVALVERDDFGAGTSSKSTKLVHGGVRYLEKAFWELDYGQYKLVSEALRERYTLLKIAPHLTGQLPIMLPIYTWWKMPYFWTGSKMYDFIAGTRKLHSSYYMSPSKVMEEFPMLKKKGLVGAMVYYDGQMNDTRMNICVALTAISKGAVCLNHVEVKDLLTDHNGKINGANVVDNITNKPIRVVAKCVINATGPFVDHIRKLEDPECKNIVVPSSGSHIILPDYYSPKNMGLLDPSTPDGRVIFFLPWQGSTLAGTTDAPCELSYEPKPLEKEIRFILHQVSSYLDPSLQVRRGDVLGAWSGIRPLVKDPSKESTESLSRTHVITMGKKGLVTVAGGKWTIFRKMAEDGIDFVAQNFNFNITPSITEQIYLVGGHGYHKELFVTVIQQFGFESEVAKHLCSTYGDQVFEIGKVAELTGKRWPVLGNNLALGYPYIEAEVRHAVLHEYAQTVVDVLARRMRLAFVNAHDACSVAPRVAEIMAEELKWDDKRKAKELENCYSFLKTTGLEEVKGTLSAFNAQEIIAFREFFGIVDTSSAGRVKYDDVVKFLEDSKIKFNKDSLHKEFTKYNSTESLDFSEFLQLMYDHRRISEKKKDVVSLDKFIIDNQSTGYQFKKIRVERSGGGI
eukprot:TRINITY_DN7233_c0_g3_i1.p1 TRINITY_DN7233_c0_g3~~TRINITY_DN7233_c0_g3_i1.p1  ORF type:complete len:711 (-),score=178.90 TRINITY_DN7233_c0_g3_i1:3-2135(-)